jgi:hypothetical protein
MHQAVDASDGTRMILRRLTPLALLPAIWDVSSRIPSFRLHYWQRHNVPSRRRQGARPPTFHLQQLRNSCGLPVSSLWACQAKWGPRQRIPPQNPPLRRRVWLGSSCRTAGGSAPGSWWRLTAVPQRSALWQGCVRRATTTIRGGSSQQ